MKTQKLKDKNRKEETPILTKDDFIKALKKASKKKPLHKKEKSG